MVISSNSNFALELLYSIVISWSESIILFNKFNGFFGMINSAVSEALISDLEYLTSLCASVATNVIDSVENWKNTPLITGLKSSFPDAKIHELIAFCKTLLGILVVDGSSRLTVFGNWSPSAYASAYFPWLELISTILLSSTVNVNGCSGNVLRVSIKSLEGIANSPLLVLSTVIDDIIVVSKSLDVIVNLELSSWNKKWSKIGIVLEELITPPRIWSFFCNELLETINFISFMIYLQIYYNGKILINKLINIRKFNY